MNKETLGTTGMERWEKPHGRLLMIDAQRPCGDGLSWNEILWPLKWRGGRFLKREREGESSEGSGCMLAYGPTVEAIREFHTK